jgi:hypothetical protein
MQSRSQIQAPLVTGKDKWFSKKEISKIKNRKKEKEDRISEENNFNNIKSDLQNERSSIYRLQTYLESHKT